MRPQSGNVLFLILIAVALFATLSYAVTKSSRGGGNNADKEVSIATSAQLVQNLALMSATIDRMLITQNRTIYQLDMFTPNFASGIGNLNGCTSTSCNIFHSDGGKIIPELPAKFIQAGSTCATGGQTRITPSINLMSIKGVGTPEPDVVIEYNCLSHKVCDEINEKLGLWKPGDAYLTVDRGAFGTGFTYFRLAGTAAAPLTPDQVGATDPRVAGQTTFCGRIPIGTIRGSLYHVLKAL